MGLHLNPKKKELLCKLKRKKARFGAAPQELDF